MIPVKMGEEQVDSGSLFRCDNFLSQIPDSGSGIENQPAGFACLYFYACGISANGRKQVVRQTCKKKLSRLL